MANYSRFQLVLCVSYDLFPRLLLGIETIAEAVNCEGGKENESSIDVGGRVLSGHVNLTVFLGSLVLFSRPFADLYRFLAA